MNVVQQKIKAQSVCDIKALLTASADARCGITLTYEEIEVLLGAWPEVDLLKKQSIKDKSMIEALTGEVIALRNVISDSEGV